MDAQVAARLVTDIIVYPCLGEIDGDKDFGEPVVIKGFDTKKSEIIVNRQGATINTKTSIIFNGTAAQQVHIKDEIELPIIGRVPIQNITVYHALSPGYELIEVYV